MERQESSHIDRNSIDHIDHNTNRHPNFNSDIIDSSPVVTSLTKPYPQASGSIRTQVASLRKIQEQEREIKKQQRKFKNSNSLLPFTTHTRKILKQVRKSPTTPRLPPKPPDLTGSA